VATISHPTPHVLLVIWQPYSAW